jgi:hypothetical protein
LANAALNAGLVSTVSAIALMFAKLTLHGFNQE